MIHGGNVHKYAREHNISVEEIYDFSANINPLSNEKLKNYINSANILDYPDPDYTALKSSISEFEQIDQEYIIPTNGGIEAIFLLGRYLDVEDITIVTPTFIEYERAFREKEISFYPLKDFSLDVDDLISSLKTRAVLLCNPNNPTGHVVKKDDLLKLLEYTYKRGIYLIIDEAFIDFIDEGSLVDRIKDYSNLMITKSLTKFFAIPGIRLGYILSSNKELITSIHRYHMPWSVNSIADHIACNILKDKEYIKKTKDFIKEEREYLYQELLKIKELRVYKSYANFIFFKADEELDTKLKKYHILIRNCNNYRNMEKGYFRIAVKDREKNKYLISKLREIYGNN